VSRLASERTGPRRATAAVFDPPPPALPGSSIFFLNRFYWPDIAATGQMLTDLAEDLARDGWNVTVLAARTGYNGGAGKLASEEWRNGVRILRISSTQFGRGQIAGRLADYLSYMVGAFLRLLRTSPPDIVVALSDPPFLLGPVLAAGRVRGFRTVFWAQDLYPYLAAKLGLLREDAASYRLLSAIARRLHARCDLVVAIGPQMERVLMAAGAPPQRTISIENWADAEAIQPVAHADNPFVLEHGLEGKFVILYSGNAGRAHTFDAVLEAARRLRRDSELVFLFIGGGRQLVDIREAAERDGLTNVRFLDYLPREQLRYSLSAASVSLVTENPEVVGLVVPSKTYGILASGRPIVFVGDKTSDVARVISDGDCGIVVSPDDPDRLVRVIRRLQHDTTEVVRLGENARRAAEEVYDRTHAVQKWAAAMGQVAVRMKGAKSLLP
jgi:colanic acid biosynthesis glycosyl transferase WcaI